MVVRKDNWTDAEIETLKAHYHEHGPSWLGWKELLPRRSKTAIQTRARKLDLHAPNGFTVDKRTKQRVVNKRKKGAKPSICGDCIFYAKQFRYESSDCGSGICTEKHARRAFGGVQTVLERYEAGNLCPYGIAKDE